MAWRDELLTASLDGVEFFYKEVSTGLGRRGILHEFAGGDTPFSEDLGRRARVYRIQAFIIGQNYQVTRKELADVLDSGRDLTFVHPYWGEFTVKLLEPAEFRESDENGGMATVDLSLTESGRSSEIVAIATPAQIKVLAANARDKLGSKTKFSLLGAIAAVLKSVANAIEAAGSLIRKVNGKINGTLSLIDNISSSLDALSDELTTLITTPQRLINTITDLIDSVIDLITGFVPPTAPLGTREVYVDLVNLTRSAMNDLANFDASIDVAPLIPTPTQQSEIEIDSHNAITAAMRGGALTSGIVALTNFSLASSEQASEIVDDLSAQFALILNSDLNGEVLDAFIALKAASIKHFTDSVQNLPQITTYTPNDTRSTLSIVYELYGRINLEDDLIRRNHIAHPSFIIGGRPLEVLTDG